MEFKATVTRDNIKKFHKLKFPNGGTETNVFIYDSTYLKNIQSNTRVKIEPLTHGTFNQKQEVLLDITKLSNGKYYVHYLSCNLGGNISCDYKINSRKNALAIMCLQPNKAGNSGKEADWDTKHGNEIQI